MGTLKLLNISCEQIYNIWSTEPELVTLLDVRSKSDFEVGRIPGSVWTEMSELRERVSKLGDKLAVIVATEEKESEVKQRLLGFKNFVFMSQCYRWTELGFPIYGESIIKINNEHTLTSSKTSEIEIAEERIEKGVYVSQEIVFQQLFESESSTYTYIIADKKSKEAAIIDPVLETVDRDIKLLEELGLKAIYALDTHIHADHITGAGELRKRLGLKTAVSGASGVHCADILLEDGHELKLGNKSIKVISTPGHTNTCLTYYFEGMIFTGDALLIRSCGRTDFQQGDSEKLFKSVRDKLFQLPDEVKVYPGHDYRGLTSSTIGAEKKHNARLKETIDLNEFKKIMSELKLANPKKIEESVPANLQCGLLSDSRVLHPQVVDGIPEITVEDLFAHITEVQAKKIRLIDVRRPDEFNNELGHVEGSELVTLGPDLTHFLKSSDRNQEIVFICRSGGRSGAATAESIQLGYKYTTNMTGGMIRWNEKKLPTEKK